MKAFFWSSWALLLIAGLIGLLISKSILLSPTLSMIYLLLCAIIGAMVLISTFVAFILFLKSINGE